MQHAKRNVLGYTLVEVLVVVSIIGILSSMGVVGLQRAVANARIRGAAINSAAFIEQVANLSRQRNEVLCLGYTTTSDPRTLLVVRDGDEGNCSGGTIASLTIDSPNQFVPNGEGCPTSMASWLNHNPNDNIPIKFNPQTIGLAATPPEGGICIKYGGDDIYGAVRKERSKNRVIPMWKVGNDATQNGDWSNWTEL